MQKIASKILFSNYSGLSNSSKCWQIATTLENNLAKVRVDGSNPFARSMFFD